MIVNFAKFKTSAFTLFFACILFVNLAAQSEDGNTYKSLRILVNSQLRNNATDSAKINLEKLKAICFQSKIPVQKAEYYYLLDYFLDKTAEVKDTSNYELHEALKIFESENDIQGIVKVKVALASDYELFKKYDLSIQNAKEGFELAEQVDSIRDQFTALRILSMNYIRLGDHKAALGYVQTATDLYEKMNLTQLKGLRPPYLLEGFILWSMGDYEKAIAPHAKYVNLCIEKEDYWKACQWSNNVASMYLQGKKDTTAFLQTLWSSMVYADKSKFKYGKANAANQLASFYLMTGALDSTKYYMAEIDKAVPVNKEPDFAAVVNQTKGDYFMKVNNPKDAIRHYQKSYKTWDKSGDIKMIRKITKRLFKAHEKSGNYKEALVFHKKSWELQDSIVNKRKIEEMKEMELTHTFNKERLQDSLSQELVLQKVELENQEILAQERQSKYIVGFTALLALMAAGFLWMAFRRKKKQSAVLAEKNEKIETLHKELSHRVKNNLAFISGLMRMQGRRLESKEAKQAVKEGESRIEAMSLLHRKLYLQEDTSVNINEYLEELCENLKNTYPSSGTIPEIKIKAGDLKTNGEAAVRIGLILNELVTNSFKYAFANQENPEINILLEKTIDKGYRLVYQDNGIGLPAELNVSDLKSLGLKLIHMLTKQLEGTLQTKKKAGAYFQFDFKEQKIAV